MKKLWSCAALFALALLISVAAWAAAGAPAAPVPSPQLEELAAEPGAPLAEDPQEDRVEASQLDSCSVTTTCPDGCVIACSGTTSCSRTSFSVTCDGRTYTCSGPRLCPF